MDGKIVVLNAGGADSAALIWWAQAQQIFEELHLLTVVFPETRMTDSVKLAELAQLPCTTIAAGSSGSNRSAVLLGLAANLAKEIGATSIGLGVNLAHNRDRADCRPNYLRPLMAALAAGHVRPLRLVTPFARNSPGQVQAIAEALGAL